MMKRVLYFILVLCFAGAVSATTVSFIAPEEGTPGSASNPLELGETLTLYVGVSDNGLASLGMNITGAGITGGILASEAGDYGGQGTYYNPPDMWFRTGSDGWEFAYDTTITGGTKAEIDLTTGAAGNVIYGPTTTPVVLFSDTPANGTATNTPIAYITIVGTGTNQVFSMANGGCFIASSSQIDPPLVPEFGGPITIYGIPEPMTICLLGLGGLLLRRRR